MFELAEPEHFEPRVLPTGNAGARRDVRALRVRLKVGRASGNAQLGVRFPRTGNED